MVENKNVPLNFLKMCISYLEIYIAATLHLRTVGTYIQMNFQRTTLSCPEQNLASVLEKRVEKVREEEKDKRRDLYTRAISYQGKLAHCKPRMMKEENFHVVSKLVNRFGGSSPTASPG